MSGPIVVVEGEPVQPEEALDAARPGGNGTKQHHSHMTDREKGSEC